MAATPTMISINDDQRRSAARAVNRGASERVVHSWRVAHAALPIAAILMFAVAALLSSFAVATFVKWLIAVALIISSYAFCLSLPLAAVVGHRGLSAAGPASANLVFAANLVGAWASVVGTLAFAYAAFVSL